MLVNMVSHTNWPDQQYLDQIYFNTGSPSSVSLEDCSCKSTG